MDPEKKEIPFGNPSFSGSMLVFGGCKYYIPIGWVRKSTNPAPPLHNTEVCRPAPTSIRAGISQSGFGGGWEKFVSNGNDMG